MNMEEPSSCSTWTGEQDKVFENALACHPEESADRWEKIAEAVGGKTVRDIEHHYQLLVEDINGIESGRVPLPSYVSSSDGSAEDAGEGGGAARRGAHSGHSHGDSGHGGKASRLDQERRKGIPWTEDEHRFFLLGLNKYGKGDWRSISRNFVISRTPTQVASHAQKYFIRLNSMNKDRRRSSIHDITTVNPSGELPPPQAPITGQTNSPVVGTGKSVKQSQSPQQQPGPPRVSMYGTTTMGQPVAGHLASAVGTPVSLPAPPHLAYGVRVPVPGAVVPGTPARIAPVTYPMPHASAHG